MLSSKPGNRPTIQEIIDSPWLDDPFVKTFNYLKKINDFDSEKSIALLKGIQKNLFCYEKDFMKKRIIPIILESAKKDYLTGIVINIVINIIKKDNYISNTEFCDQIWPSVVSLTKGSAMKAQALFLLVNNIEHFDKMINRD